MEQSKYLLKFLLRSEWNSVASPRHKYFVKIEKDHLEGQGIPQDLLTMTHTFNCSICFILDSPSYTSESNGMSETQKKPPSLLAKITCSKIFFLNGY